MIIKKEIYRVKYNGRNIEMKDGVFRLVPRTIREGEEYPLSEINPNINLNANELSKFWQHISLSYELSQATSQFSTSTITNIGTKLQLKLDKIKQLFSEIESDIQGDLELSFEPVKNPYKPQIIGIRIDGYQDGQLFGTIGLDRALPASDEDLSLARTVPFTEDQAEAPQEYITPYEAAEVENPHTVQY